MLEDRGFRIDIALPEYKIGIEINGNQHYKKIDDLLLDDYYEERHKLVENCGWKLIELYYKTVYNHDIKDIILSILNNKSYEYNLETKKYIISCINKKIYCKKCNNEIIYGHKCKICQKNKNDDLKNKKIKKLKNQLKKLKKLKQRYKKINERYDLCNCGNKKLHFSPTCGYCNHLKQRKVKRPPYEQLIKDIKEMGYRGTGKKYSVSDNAIRKWKINYEKSFL